MDYGNTGTETKREKYKRVFQSTYMPNVANDLK